MAEIRARAIFDYDSNDRDDLSFREGDMITIVSKEEGEWWFGRADDGRQGYFPFNRVEELKGGARRAPQGPAQGIRQAKEKVSRVDVEESKRAPGAFQVAVVAGGSPIIKERTIFDVRCFDKALRMLLPGVDFTATLTPEWADEIPISVSAQKVRADIVSKFLNQKCSNPEIFDLLLISWINDTREAGGGRVEIGAADGRPAVMKKVSQALGAVYGGRPLDPIRWFAGSEKTGDLVRATFEWQPRDGTELQLAKADYVLVAMKRTKYDGWWYGQKVDGTKGLFPSNYIVDMKEDDIRKKIQALVVSPPAVARTRTEVSRVPASIVSPTGFAASGKSAGVGGSGGAVRDRKVEQDFFVKTIEGYDELRSEGITIEVNGRHASLKSLSGRGSAKDKDFVTLSFSAYVWDPQTNLLREFSSSDKLAAPPQGVETGFAGANGIKMEFVVGDRSAIDGLESVVTCLSMNKTARVVISPDKGYGDVGSPPEIPGNCYLVYDLTLEKVANGMTYKPPRNQVFSVGISRPNVQERMPSRQIQRGGAEKTRKKRR